MLNLNLTDIPFKCNRTWTRNGMLMHIFQCNTGWIGCLSINNNVWIEDNILIGWKRESIQELKALFKVLVKGNKPKFPFSKKRLCVNPNIPLRYRFAGVTFCNLKTKKKFKWKYGKYQQLLNKLNICPPNAHYLFNEGRIVRDWYIHKIEKTDLPSRYSSHLVKNNVRIPCYLSVSVLTSITGLSTYTIDTMFNSGVLEADGWRYLSKL